MMFICLHIERRKYDEDYFSSLKILETDFNYSLLRNKNLGLTPQRYFSCPLRLYDNQDYEYNFPVFRDNDIGILSKWQEPIIETMADEDVDSGDEQIKVGKSFVINDIKEAFEFVEKNKEFAVDLVTISPDSKLWSENEKINCNFI